MLLGLYYETGALASRNDILSVIPFLFKTDLPLNSPLAHLNHIKYDGNNKTSEKAIKKMIKDIKRDACFKNSTDKQTDLCFDEAYMEFISNLNKTEMSLDKERNKKTLKDWALQNNIKNADLYVDDNVKLDIAYFEQFISNRKQNLIKKIKQITGQ